MKSRSGTRSDSTRRGPTPSRVDAKPISALRARISYDLCDPGTFVEYGPMVIAAQRRRRTIEELVKKTPADGMLAGIGASIGDLFGDAKSQLHPDVI